MDVTTGNIYTEEQRKILGIAAENLIPLDDEMAEAIIKERQEFARLLKEVARETHAKLKQQKGV